MSIQITDMFKLGDTFIIQGQEANTTPSKIGMLAITALT